MANNKRKRVRLTTPAGVASYPYLTKPDTQFNSDGDFKVDLVLDKEEHADFLARIDELAEKAFDKAVKQLKKEKKMAQAKQLEKHIPYEDIYDEETGEPTGQVKVKFKSKAKFKRKDGSVAHVEVALFDAQGKAINPKNISIYGGSIIKVNFTPNEFHATGLKLAGISLRLNAVQIIELVSDGGNAGSFGFDKVDDGYSFDDDSAVTEEGEEEEGELEGTDF